MSATDSIAQRAARKTVLPAVLCGALAGGIVAGIGEYRVGQTEKTEGNPTAPAIAAQPAQSRQETHGWEWLGSPGGIVPGGRIRNASADEACSVGWIAAREERIFVITAGHCGHAGDSFTYANSQDEETTFGVVVASENEGVARDYSIIELFSDQREMVRPLPLENRLDGPGRVEDLAVGETEVCRLGHRTGLSCGPLLEVDSAGGGFAVGAESDYGDSGGPVYTIRDGDVIGLGIVTGFAQGNNEQTFAQDLSTIVRTHNLTLLSD